MGQNASVSYPKIGFAIFCVVDLHFDAYGRERVLNEKILAIVVAMREYARDTAQPRRQVGSI